MITLTGVRAAHGARVLFDGVSLRLAAGRHIGLVGPNGAGKTTLLEIVAGERAPSAGTVVRAKEVRTGYLRQDVAEARDRTVLQHVLDAAVEVRALERRLRELEGRIAAGGVPEHLLEEYGTAQARFELAGGYTLESQARKVLAGLGFAPAQLQRSVGTLSGGWMMRIALARLLVSAPDVLLLDEPTNHLDLASVEWLEAFVAGYEGAVLLVSHDRDFLNATCNRIAELDGGAVTEYVGDYEAFAEQRALRSEQLRAAARNQQRRIAHDERFIERFRYKATKARQVQSRVKRLDRLERLTEPDEQRRAMGLRFPAPPRCGRQVATLAGVAKRYGDHVVYEHLDLVLERGGKVALVGPNGAGKSTLLKLLAGATAPDAGTLAHGHNVRPAYYAQHALDELDPGRTALEEVAGVLDPGEVNPRALLGAFLFPGEDADKHVAVLSGGERARLALAKLMARPANLLCLDEPTNHLDVHSRDVVEDALSAYQGTVVLITHDRHLIRAVADTIVEVRDGRATVHPGGYEDYLDRVRAQSASADPPAPARGSRKRAEAERRNHVHRETRELRREVDRVEEALGAAEAEIAELQRLLADPSVYGDPDRVRELAERHRAAKDRSAELTDEWERRERALAEALAVLGGADSG